MADFEYSNGAYRSGPEKPKGSLPNQVSDWNSWLFLNNKSCVVYNAEITGDSCILSFFDGFWSQWEFESSRPKRPSRVPLLNNGLIQVFFFRSIHSWFIFHIRLAWFAWRQRETGKGYQWAQGEGCRYGYLNLRNMIYWRTISRAIQMTHGFPTSLPLVSYWSISSLIVNCIHRVSRIPRIWLCQTDISHIWPAWSGFWIAWLSLALLRNTVATGYHLSRSIGPWGCASANGFQRGMNT